MGDRYRLTGGSPGRLELALQPSHLGLELQDPSDALEVEPLVGEVLDLPQALEVAFGEASAAALGPGRVEESLALVDTQCLGMDPGELGGHRDHIDGTRPVLLAHVTPPMPNVTADP